MILSNETRVSHDWPVGRSVLQVELKTNASLQKKKKKELKQMGYMGIG